MLQWNTTVSPLKASCPLKSSHKETQTEKTQISNSSMCRQRCISTYNNNNLGKVASPNGKRKVSATELKDIQMNDLAGKEFKKNL